MKRRQLFLLCLTPVTGWSAGSGPSALRGKLVDGPALRTPAGATIGLSADPATMLVLKDSRLAGADFEVLGKSAGPASFRIDPIHTRALYAYQKGARLMVTYWCDVCYIRTYSPGVCWCCQDDTRLDLIDPATVDKK